MSRPCIQAEFCPHFQLRTGWGERDTFPSAVTWEPHPQPCPSPRHGTPKHPHDGAVLRPPASGVHRAHVSAADPSSRSPEEAASAGSDAGGHQSAGDLDNRSQVLRALEAGS